MPTPRSTPRVSVSALSQYLSAGPAARRRIVHDQKYPPTFRQIYYDEACDAIVQFLLDPAKDEELLVGRIDALHAKSPKHSNDKIRLANNAEAIEAFLKGWKQIELGGATLRRGSNNARKMTVCGVDVSVRPELLMSIEVGGAAHCAALKLFFSKGDPLDADSASYVGALLAHYVEACSGGDTRLSKKHTQIIDVFKSAVHRAPSATKARFREVEAACEEIRLMWPAA